MNRIEHTHITDIEHDDSGKLVKVCCHNCTQKLDVSSLSPFEHIHCPRCDEEIIVPIWFEHYLFEEHVGDAKFANTYRALDLTLDREVAVKVLKPEYRKQYSGKFLEAARKAARLNHFSITPIYSCGEFKGQPYFVAQYLDEGTLADILHNDGPLPLRKALPWMVEVTEGLHYASKRGMVHHAVTLRNMPLFEGRAKISDFTSSFFENSSLAPSLNSQHEDNLDIFNLGTVFYQLLTGVLPTEGNAETENIPDNIQALILKMLTEGAVNQVSYSEIIKVLKGGKLSEPEVAPRTVIKKESTLMKWVNWLLLVILLALVIIFIIIYYK